MGILSSITKAVYKVVDPVITAVARPVDTVKAILSPTKTVKDVSTEFFSQSKIKQAAEFVTNVALVGGTGLGVAKVGVSGVAKAITPTTLKGKVIAAAAAPVVAGAIISQPEAASKAPAKAAAELAEFGAGLGELIVSPSIESAKSLISSSPILTAGTVALAASPLIIPAVKGAFIGEAIGDVEQAIRETQPTVLPQPSISTTPTPIISPIVSDVAATTTNPEVPILSTDKPKKRRAKTKTKPVPQVKITNRNINKLVAVLR